MNINYKNIILIIFISITTGLLFNFYKNNNLLGYRVNPDIENTAKSDNYQDKSKIIRLINTSEAKDFFNKNDALFIDARDSWEFSDSHILNSINIPEYNYNPNNPIIKLLDKNGIYITYCSADDCDLSRRLATKLKTNGFKNVFVYSEGFEKWIELRYPIFRK